MEIKLVPVRPEDKGTLINLYQLYEHDFSRFTNRDIDKNGRYEVNIDFYWEGDERWNPFYIEVSGTIAGFLVVLFENMDIDPDPTHVIYDFMILQKYRRTGIGRAAAIKAFKMYNADWAVTQMENNTPAISFWRNVIKSFKEDNFTERYRPERKKYIQELSTKT
ncbi:GNAT family N-acetyltransferase [Paenibacillus durus]|uniref:GCN5 family acetyltransferase n=1 Tax=Paenibacillus durus TaxID=44251 RepID=A0A089HU84_PAEDU|nr:GNAT family N-acetyltransferase [Paenibacillus durus]AIQ14310.1 GCN5 family acetyltransferase [Paenibacillus durus]